MRKPIEQLGLFGENKIVKPKRRGKNTSFLSRLYLQHKNLIEAIQSENDLAISIELQKSLMLIKEKEDKDNEKRMARSKEFS